MKKRRRSLRVPCLSFLALVLVASGLWAGWNELSARRFEAALARYRSARLPASVATVRPGDVPAAENGATLYLAAIEKARSIPRLDFDAFPEISDELRHALDGAGDLLELMRQASLRKHCVFPRDYSDLTRDTPIPVGEILKPARLLAARSVLRAQAGDLAPALDDLHAVFRTSEALRADPFILTQLVGLTVASTGTAALEVVLPLLPAAREALAGLDVGDFRGSLRRAMRAEAAMMVAYLKEQERTGFPDLLELDTEENTVVVGLPAGYGLVRALGPLARPYLRADVADLLDHLRTRLEAMRQPYAQALTRLHTLDERLRDDAGLVERLLLVRGEGLLAREARIVTQVRLSELAASCLDHRRTRGKYPTHLAELALGDAAATTDPLTEEPYAIVERDGATTLESRGPIKVSWSLP